MSKITEFYSHRDSLAQASSSAQLDTPQWEAIEEKLIREDVLPRLMSRIAPVISEVRSALSLTINYDPNGALSLSFTRNCLQMTIGAVPPSAEPNNETQNTDEVSTDETDNEQQVNDESAPDESSDAEPEPEAEPEEEKKPERKKSIPFRVKFGDGTIIFEKKAARTFKQTLQKIGLDYIVANQRKHEAYHNVEG